MMSAKRRPKPKTDDLIWFCRRLASALQGGTPVLAALDALGEDAPDRLHAALPTVRSRVRAGGRIPDALDELGWPSFVSAIARYGDAQGDLAASLQLAVEALELEQDLARARSRELRAFALAFGRLGPMFRGGVPALTAIQCAAESVAGTAAQEALTAAGRAVRGGEALSDALDRLAPDLPEMTTDMIRDGERDGRLGDVLSVVADYLLDESASARRVATPRKQEARNA
jgi:type II secretory pathway component PulF